jgi:peptidoglycan biosynthesis protein MviN/MurJ (putative lipid II flippase)
MGRLTQALRPIFRRPRGEIASATALLTAAALIGKPVTFARDLTVARHFGATSAVDFVVFAQIAPLFLVNIVSDAVIYRLPSIVRDSITEYGDERVGIAVALNFARRVLTMDAVLVLVGGAIAAVAVTISGWRGISFPAGIIMLACAQALLDTATAMYAQVLQVSGRFKRPVIQYAANGLVTLVVILVLSPSIGLWAWPIGLVIDSAWRVAFIVSALPKRRRAAVPVEKQNLSFRDAARRAAAPMTLAGLTLVYAVSDRIAGPLAGVGVLALWSWASQLGQASVGLTSLPVATAVFSRGHTTGEREARVLGTAWLFSVGLAVVAALLFLVVGPAVVDLLYGSKALNSHKVHMLTVLAGFALFAAVGVAMFAVSSRALMSHGSFRDAIKAFGLGAALYPIVVFATLPWLEYKALGLALLVAAIVSGYRATRIALKRGLMTIPSPFAMPRGSG